MNLSFAQLYSSYINGDLCDCEDSRGISIIEEDFSYIEICTSCNKPIEFGLDFYNHYDGEDHEEIDLY